MEWIKKNKGFLALITFSIIWCSGALWLLSSKMHFDILYIEMDLNELGDYLAGAFSPLAFLWLVYGYFMQNKELAMNREELIISRKALESQAKELANSVDQQKEMASITKQEIEYNKTLNLERKVENSIKHLPIISWNSLKSAKSNSEVQENNKIIKLKENTIKITLTNQGKMIESSQFYLKKYNNFCSYTMRVEKDQYRRYKLSFPDKLGTRFSLCYFFITEINEKITYTLDCEITDQKSLGWNVVNIINVTNSLEIV